MTKSVKTALIIALALIIFSIALIVLSVTYLKSKNPDQPPQIKISTGNTEIKYYTLKNTWNGDTFDRLSAYQNAFSQNPDMTGLLKLDSGSNIILDFGNTPPDKFTVSCEFLTPGNQGGKNEESQLKSVSVPVSCNNGEYSFNIENNMDALLSSGRIVGQIYVVTANWGQNECEYSFLINVNEVINTNKS